MTVKHLDWLNCSSGYYHMSYPELGQYIKTVYYKLLEPLRLEYRSGQIDERIHQLLTQGNKYAYEVCRDHDVPWPPEPENHFVKQLYDLMKEKIEIEHKLQQLNHRVGTLNELY